MTREQFLVVNSSLNDAYIGTDSDDISNSDIAAQFKLIADQLDPDPIEEPESPEGESLASVLKIVPSNGVSK